MSDEVKSFTGSCHCRAIKYKVKLTYKDGKPPQVSRCNCTVCQKPGFTSLSIDNPSENFELLSPSSKDQVKQYVYRNPKCPKFFCDKCGVQVFSEGQYEFNGKKVDFFSVNFNTIDQPQEGIDLSTFKLKYFDGLHDNWTGGLEDAPRPGGTW